MGGLLSQVKKKKKKVPQRNLGQWAQVWSFVRANSKETILNFLVTHTFTQVNNSFSSSSPSITPKSYLLTPRASALACTFSAAIVASHATSPSIALNPNWLYNVAVIVEVDHSKTTFMDLLLRQYGDDIPYERPMDFISLERERGITIVSKVIDFVQKCNAKCNLI